MPNGKITKIIKIESTRSAAFDALTNPDEIKSYFPIKEVNSEWKVGGVIEFVSEEGGTDEGLIEVFDRNSCFQYSYWNQNHGRERNSDNLITIAYSLEDTDIEGVTLLTMNQMNLPSVFYKEMMNPVWDQLLEKLKCHIEK